MVFSMGAFKLSLFTCWKRAAIIGFGMASLWFIGDIPEFEKDSLSYYLNRYFLMGVMVTLFVGGALSFYWRVKTPESSREEFRGQLVVTLLALIPGIYIPAYIGSIFDEEPIVFADLWSLYFYAVITAAVFLLQYARQSAALELLEVQAATAESRYHSLKSQMQPHFLFNSLNSLASLIAENPLAAESMTEKLAELYRQILQASTTKTATLASEISIARLYLEIESLRFGERLRFEISVPVEAEKIHLPSLMLQTLVENAVKHGISPSLEGGAVSIVVHKTGSSWYRLEISNNGKPLTSYSLGTGLMNTLARLRLLYGDRHDFRFQSDDKRNTVVSFLFSGEAFAQ